MSASDEASEGQSGLVQTALFGLCPRCGAKALWEAPAAFAPTCRGCRLAFADYETRGRGLYFVLLPLIALLMAGALKLDEAVRPPLWLLLGLIVVLVPSAIIGALRLMKCALLLARLRAAGVLP